MHNHENDHPHGNFTPDASLGICLVREPNGLPDALLIARSSEQATAITAANILSVQGYTARIAIVFDIPLFLAQEYTYQSSIFSDLPKVRIALMDYSEAAAITHLPIYCTGSTATAAEIANIALSMIKAK